MQLCEWVRNCQKKPSNQELDEKKEKGKTIKENLARRKKKG